MENNNVCVINKKDFRETFGKIWNKSMQQAFKGTEAPKEVYMIFSMMGLLVGPAMELALFEDKDLFKECENES